MFSEHAVVAAQTRLEKVLACAGDEKRREISDRLSRIQDADVALAIKWLYGNSPLSDLANYDFELFHACAKHGVFLRSHSPHAKDMPEEIFLNYVLHSRVNEEELCDCREFFYEQLCERINGMPCSEAVLEINYWNAEHMMYQATDARTISALNAYRSGYGRCGEESAFAVNVFRAMGIAARQIYTPRWAHCDDNHAWVEVWIHGEWHFLGACEPEEVLDKAWFTNASSRAMLIHSRCFGDISTEECIGKKGMALFLNNLKGYAETKTVLVRVRDPQGEPCKNAEVSFGILNYSTIFPAADIMTDENGEAQLTCGLGSLFVRVRKDGISCERLVYVPDTDRVEMTLENEIAAYDIWKDFTVTAPRDGAVRGRRLSEDEKLCGIKKTTAANEKRGTYVKSMFDLERAEAVVAQYGYHERICALLEESRGNFERLLAFLEDESYSVHEKEMLLSTLSHKDKRDVDADILREALDFAQKEGCKDEALLYSYVICPRIYNEPLSKYRQFILAYFSVEEKERFKKDPTRVWGYISQSVGYDASLEYGQIVTMPVGALTVKKANPLSKKILFVAICRSLGIPARINPMNQQPEYYRNGAFVPLEADARCSGTLCFVREDTEGWQYGADFAFARLLCGAYQSYRLSDEAWVENTLTVAVEPGDYRIITDNRLPNGDIHASSYHVRIEGGETKRITLRKSPAAIKDMLASYALEDFRLTDKVGKPVWGSALTTKGVAVLMWLEAGKEPTEHILNEMLESAEDFETLGANIIFILRGREVLENEKLRSVLERFKTIRVLYDEAFLNVETLARRLYVDPEKLPLVAVTASERNAVYASSGYNVGSGSMIVRICRSVME